MPLFAENSALPNRYDYFHTFEYSREEAANLFASANLTEAKFATAVNQGCLNFKLCKIDGSLYDQRGFGELASQIHAKIYAGECSKWFAALPQIG